MKKYLFLLLALLLLQYTFAQVNLTHLLVEGLEHPIGLDIQQPRFSWQLNAAKRNVQQSAYQVKVMEDKRIVWNSGKVNSDQSVFVAYQGGTLQSGKKYTWQVRVWDNSGKMSSWSTPSFWQTGFFSLNDWKAKWIESVITNDSVNAPPILFRKEFSAGKKIKSATVYITSRGMYEAKLNGKRIGDAYLTPGWTSYKNRLQYQSYDVTGLLKTGLNAIGVTVGSGWFRTPLGWETNRNLYGRKVGLLLQLEIEYADGSHATVVSDGTWTSSQGAIRSSEIYNGEFYDARLKKNGWTTTSYKDDDWSGVMVKDYANDILLATYNQPIRKHETFKPVKIVTTPKGEKVIDFGQNLVGWVVMKANGKKGDTVTVSHAEVLDRDGNFYTDNLRGAKAQDIYILDGEGEEVLEPHFTFHGFRYIRIEGYPGELKPENFTAVSLYSDMPFTGTFTCSDPLLNQLQHNIQWGQRGNFLDVPTDCPQRDERLGWTGDAQAFSRTAMFNMDVHNFFLKWLKDVAADQSADGRVPFVVPNVLNPQAGGSAGWADVATIVPWNLYLAYGDTQVLKNQYASMKAWVGFMQKNSRDYLWNTGFHFGDWLFYRPFDDNDGRSAVTDKYLIAQCFFAYSTQLLINAANVLGKSEDVHTYSELLQHIKDAFLKEYMTPSGRLVSGTQTAYVLALNFDMLPESLRKQAAERLAENVKSYDNHLTTGFLGTPYLCHVLSRYGYDSLAYKLLLQKTYPSWLYPVTMGATTIWERWDGEKPDGTFQTPGMNSFNHYAYGAIGDWMYRVMAGIDTYNDGVGYKHIRIQPHIGQGVDSVRAELATYYGKIAVKWKTANGQLVLDVAIPANTRATIYIPAQGPKAITESGTPLSSIKEITIEGAKNGYVAVDLGSGTYYFSTTRQ
ncbi:MAG TPA: family 78 glycoside hydrolase catalytic domain [Chitinophagaceae bacterium]|nr:family 78 glycoside hydrolase catalytic domain [Chitinophagaceae bacterium]